MKNPFKKGDLVKHKLFPKWGVGKVVEIEKGYHGLPWMKVEWACKSQPAWHFKSALEFANLEENSE